MKLVVVESPYAGDIPRNVRYAQACMADCLKRGEAPYASHLLYTQPGVLRDEVADERKLGISAGFVWGSRADLVAIYTDLGITEGMQQGIARAKKAAQQIDYRQIGWKVPDDELAKRSQLKLEYENLRGMLGSRMERIAGVEVDTLQRQTPVFEQWVKGVYERCITGEIDSTQGTASAYILRDDSRIGLLHRRGTLSYRQYMAGRKQQELWWVAGLDARTTSSYGESMGGGECHYGMAPTEMAYNARQRLREARDAMGTVLVTDPSKDKVAIPAAPFVEACTLRDGTLRDVGNLIAEAHCHKPKWSKTHSENKGRECVLAGLDGLADAWQIREPKEVG